MSDNPLVNQGELTSEALATLDVYIKCICNKAATARKLKKAYQQIFKFLRQPYVRELFKLKLLEKGVTPDNIAGTISDGLSASNGVYYEGGKVADEANWAARQRFAQLAADIFEVVRKDQEVIQDQRQLHITLTTNEATAIVDKLQDLNNRLLGDEVIQNGEVV